MEVTEFILNRRGLHQALQAIKKLSPSYFKHGFVKINVLPEHVEIHVVGITRYLPAQTEGYYDVYLPLRLLFAMSSTFDSFEIKFIVREGELQCGNAIFSSPEIKIRNIFDTNNDIMPLNASEFDLLKYAYKATKQEIDDFGLTQRVKNAREKLDIRLCEVAALLADYGITKSEIETLIVDKFTLKQI